MIKSVAECWSRRAWVGALAAVVLASGVGLAIPERSAAAPNFPTSAETTFVKSWFTPELRAALKREGAKLIADTMWCKYIGRQRWNCSATYWVQWHDEFAEYGLRVRDDPKESKAVGRPRVLKPLSRTKPVAPVDVDQCVQGSPHQPDLRAPIVANVPGGLVEVLFIDRRDSYVRDCVFSGHTLRSATGESLSALPAPGDPTAIAYEAPLCIQDGRHKSSVTFGRVGANVTAATFEFAHGKPVEGGVISGFYEAAWSSGANPDQIILTTTTGATVNVQVPTSESSGTCLNVTGLAKLGG
jgi:hypothetical protein